MPLSSLTLYLCFCRGVTAINVAVSAYKTQARIGHFVEAQILEAIEVDYIDESEVLTMADEDNHINKRKFTVPFVCGCRNLGEALVSVFSCDRLTDQRLYSYPCLWRFFLLNKLFIYELVNAAWKSRHELVRTTYNLPAYA